MPRIPYQPEDLAEPAEVVDAIRRRRGGKLLELDRMLLHSAPLAAGWNVMMGKVRNEFVVAQRLRELAMCTVAVLNGADYEFAAHAPIFLAEGGTQEQLDAIRADPDAAARNTALFGPQDAATLALTIEMTRNVKDATFARIEALLERRELVELIATVAAYNMVSRFLVATGITH
jgi:alkylhydroperoxidase family enzyme